MRGLRLGMVAAALVVAGFRSTQPVLLRMVPIALPVVIGTVLAICLGNAGGRWVNSALSKSIPVWIGLISYSLYLWHSPVLLFSRYYLIYEFTPVQTVIAAVTIFALAFLPWRFVECLLHNRTIPLKRVLLWIGEGVVIAAVLGVTIVECDGFPQRLNARAAQINFTAI